MFKFRRKPGAESVDNAARMMSRVSSNTMLSVAAMGLSSLSTYLTFFDASYTLTVTAAKLETQVQRGYSSSNNKKEVTFRRYVTPQMVISNRGTRPLVLSDVELVASTRLDKCEASDTIRKTQVDATIIEPGTVRQVSYNFGLEPIDLKTEGDTPFELEATETLWCLRWVVFDPDGKRREPLSELFVANTTYPEDQIDEDGFPQLDLKVELEQRPKRLVSKALF